MIRKLLYLATFATALSIFADVAMASILPAPFEFSFVSSALTGLLLLPLQLVGCG